MEPESATRAVHTAILTPDASARRIRAGSSQRRAGIEGAAGGSGRARAASGAAGALAVAARSRGDGLRRPRDAEH
ncbi:MAG: hypothetical protein ACJ786_05235 [Catenulispora sp.]